MVAASGNLLKDGKAYQGKLGEFIAAKGVAENNALGCAGSSNPYCVGKNDQLTTSGDKDGESQPNVGKDLTDEQKKELGGTGSGTPGGWGPEDEQQGRDKNLSVSDKRSIKSLEEQIRLHEDKLEAYKKNPDSFDNKGYL